MDLRSQISELIMRADCLRSLGLTDGAARLWAHIRELEIREAQMHATREKLNAELRPE